MTAARLLHVFQNFDTGGIQLRTAAYINQSRCGWRHRILAWDGTYDAAQRIAKTADVTLLQSQQPQGGLIRRLRQMARLIEAEKPDLLLTYNWGAVEAALANALFCGVPHVHHEAGFGVEEAKRQLPRRVWFRRLALRRTRHIIVPSRTLVAVIDNIWKLPPAKVRRIPDGIDIARFSTPPDPQALPGFVRRPGDVVVGTVTPLRPEKNIGRFLRMIAALKARGLPVRALIVGDGAERPGLEALAQALGLAADVHFAGFISAVEKVYGLCDVFAITSETEQLPNGVLQAMAARRPVVGTDVGDIAVMVAAANRPFVVAVEDEAALADAAAQLLTDPALRVRLGNDNHAQAAAEYGLDAMVAAYDMVYREALR
ncbi:MAG: glycosyltransferase family 4 protein [Sphingomonadales bacterium]